MNIIELTNEYEKKWNEYVMNHLDGTFYHLIGWKKAVEKSYGHKPYYFIAIEGEQIKGVLPLFLMKSRILGNKLVSLPFANYGGILMDDAKVENELVIEAEKLAKKMNVDYLEFKNRRLIPEISDNNDKYFSLILTLENDLDKLMKNFRKNTRRYIKKSEEEGIEIIKNSEDVRTFYKIYCKRMKDLGSPPHKKDFFYNLCKEFPNQVGIYNAKYQEKIIATIFLLYHKNIAIYAWGASIKKYNNLNPNYLLFWELIKDLCSKGYSTLDFGKSLKDSGTYFFKEGFEAVPKQIYHQYFLYRAKVIPDNSQLSRKRQLFAKFWSKLPLTVTKIIGPKLRRCYG